MPISKILPDGRVEIYNTKTGEIKQVTPEELPAYNPKMVGQYLQMKGETPSPVKELADVKATKELSDIEAGVEGPQGTPEQQFKIGSATRAIGELERLYGRGSPENVGTGEDLSLSKGPSTIAKGAAKVGRGFGKFFGIDRDLTEDISKYEKQQLLARVAINQAIGAGTPSGVELEGLMESMPSASSTDEEAKSWFESVRVLLGEDREKKKEIGVDLTKVPDTTLPEQIDQTEDTGDSFIRKAALKAADIAPGAGGLIGGVAGGALGAGLLSGVTGVAGAGAGIAGGKVIQNTIRDLLGVQDKTAEEQVRNATTAIAKEAAFEALGFGVGKFVLAPIAKGGGYILKSLVKNIDDIPLRGVRFNPSQLTKFAKKHTDDVAEFMVKRGYLGDEAIELAAKDAQKVQSAFDNLALNKNIEVPVKSLQKRFSEEISELAGKGERIVPNVNKKLAKDLLTEWDSILGQIKRQGRDAVGLEELTLFRRNLDELIPDSAFVSRPIKNLHLRLRSMFNDVIQKTVDERMLTAVAGEGKKGTLKELGQELSRLYDFLEMAEKQSNLGRGSLLPNLTRILTGTGGAGIGAAVGGLPGAVVGGGVGLASEALLRDPNVLKQIYRAGKVTQPFIKKTIPRGIKAIPQASAAITQLLGGLSQ